MDRNLTSLLIKKAEIELRETELRKKQSLEQFQEWLRKHPYLKRTRRDDKYLTLYLRTKKYSLNDVFKVYERHFLFRIKRSDWFDLSDDKILEVLRSHIECGSKYVIMDNTSLEPVTFIARFEKFDMSRNELKESFCSDFLLAAACLELEKTQICGFKTIVDFTNVPLSFFALLSVNDVMDWAKSFASCPGRYKQIIIVNLPSIAIHFYNIASMLMTEKMRNRLVLIKNYEELNNFMDTSKLPEFLGGCGDEQTYINESLKIVDENLKFLKASNNYEIDVFQVHGNLHSEDVGSFRKLEID